MRYLKVNLVVPSVLIVAALIGDVAPADGGIKGVLRAVAPAVVSVLAYDAEGKQIAFGSGFIVRADGLVVSNHHVIQRAHHAQVRLASGDAYDAVGVVAVDGERDYVILKIQGYDLPTVAMGNSNKVEVGDEVIAVGHPLRLEHTVSTGIISQRRQLGAHSMLQISAPISKGSSGGPLLNGSGQVIGITTAGMAEGQNLNFALPINYVLGALETNAVVRYSLADVAKAQERRDKEEVAERVAKLFAVLREPDFSMAYPRQWTVERAEGWDDGRTTFHRFVMIAPRDASAANVMGYLSEGIRIHLMYPPSGKVWSVDRVEDWGQQHMKNMLAQNPGFALTGSAMITFAGQPAQIYSLVGQGKSLPEPEKATFVVLANPQYRLVIELVRPVGKLKEYDSIYPALLKTFELGGRASR